MRKDFVMAGNHFSVLSDTEYDFGVAEDIFSAVCAENAPIYYEIAKDDPCTDGSLLYCGDIFSVYRKDNTIYRRYTNLNGAFVLSYNIDSPLSLTLYGDEKQLKEQQKKLIQSYFALEVPFIHNNTYILHSSAVIINNKAVLFCGASGTGKSTQADLWHKYLNVEIINGDRSCVKVTDNGVSAYGSIFAGSSGIYKNTGAIIKAIVLPVISTKNKISLLSPDEAFSKIYSQTLNNPWDREFTEKLTSLLTETVKNIPVYLFYCRADNDAVQTAYNDILK